MAPQRSGLRVRRERVKRQISITQSLAQGAAGAMKAAVGAAAAAAAAMAMAAVAASASSGQKEVKATKKAKAAASTKNVTKAKKLKDAPSRPARLAVAGEDSVAYASCGSQESPVADEDSQVTLTWETQLASRPRRTLSSRQPNRSQSQVHPLRSAPRCDDSEGSWARSCGRRTCLLGPGEPLVPAQPAHPPAGPAVAAVTRGALGTKTRRSPGLESELGPQRPGKNASE